MSKDESTPSETPETPDSSGVSESNDSKTEKEGLERRQFLKKSGAVLLPVGVGKGVYNVFLGYGKNLKTQDFGSVASERMFPSYEEEFELTEYTVKLDGLNISVLKEGEKLEDHYFFNTPREKIESIDSKYGLDGSPAEELFLDVPDIRDDNYEFELYSYDEFFERLKSADTRPFTVSVLRGDHRDIDPSLVEEFAGVDPRYPKELLLGLEEAFEDKSSYDIPRYIAGAITYNILFKVVDIRDFFDPQVSYEALNSEGGNGMFCSEYAERSIEALHSVSAVSQKPPIFGISVHDKRHKHVFTGVGSAVRSESGALKLPMTFVDYTHSTLYSDFFLTGLLGEGFEAYDARHRADEVYWE